MPGCDVEDQHCLLVVERGRVILHPLNGDCFINHCRITSSGRLRQGKPSHLPSPLFLHPPSLSYIGDLLQLGSSAVFRFNHPQEARRLRRRHSVRSVSVSSAENPIYSGSLNTQERLLDCHKLTNRRHCLKRNRVQSTPILSLPLHSCHHIPLLRV